MKRTLTLITALFLWTSGCSDQPLAPEIQLTPDATSSAVATANGITITSIEGETDPVAVNTPAQITADFTGASGDTHTGVIRWGDGASSVATISETDGTGTATGTRSYVLPGVYTVEVEISNQSAESVLGTHEYVTVYDPDGGYVSGNGAILSPANACTLSGCVADEGAARFGFSSRYVNGAAVPDGNTRFTFRDGNFTFSSTEYDWLVISGARAQYKGLGTVNREGNYGFMLTSTDSDRAGGGEEDRFRIKIWDRDNDDAIVYDNQSGAGDDAELSADGTRLTRGSITIRSTTRNEAPVVIITSPADGATFLETEGILLSADAGDAEDGDLSASVVWSSDVAGELGEGAELPDVSLAPGTHSITAYVVDTGGLEATASVAVEIAKVAISVSPTAATISEGETQQFTATVYADGVEMLSDGPTVAWSSSDLAVATVDSDGLVTGVGAGEATVTAAIGDITTGGVLTVEELPVGPEILAATVAAGGFHSCGLDVSGNAYCWGHNDVGQLGQGTEGAGTDSNKPVAVIMPPGESFVAIRAGSKHTVALTATGSAYAWGQNRFGQLGDGTGGYGTNSSTPVAVIMPTGESFVAVSANVYHTVALTATGAAYAWGYNYYGQLGDGTTTPSSTPVAVSLPTEEAIIGISAGQLHTAALTATGAAYAWGYNYSGQLGNGTRTNSSTPVAVSTTESFVSIDAAAYHTVALTATGAAYAWGANPDGQLGDGTTTSSSTPVAVSLPANGFTAISANYFSTVALTADGVAYGWGPNNHGQLGNGTTTNSSTPVAASTTETFTAIRAGGYHTVALTSAGNAFAWGYNYQGQLGDGTTTNSNTPTAVSGGITFAY